jgi:hypothetical protein
MAFKGTELLAVQSLKDHLGEVKLKRFINFVLRYIADLDIPIKRGTFIEFRSGMLNVSPIGRNCSQQERCDFEVFDKQRHVRSVPRTEIACHSITSKCFQWSMVKQRVTLRHRFLKSDLKNSQSLTCVVF